MNRYQFHPTLYHVVEYYAQLNPEKIAIFYDGQAFNYRKLLEKIQAVAVLLKKTEIVSGDRVGVACKGKLNFLISIIASMAASGIPVPLPDNSASELELVLDDCTPKIIIYDDSSEKEFKIILERQSSALIDLSLIDKSVDQMFQISETVKSDCVAMMLYTSGTTGNKKGVQISYNNLQTTISYLNEFMGVDSTINEYIIAPINHAFGFVRCRAVLEVGGTIVFDDGVFNPAKVLLTLQQKACNAVSSGSSGFAIMIEHFESFLKSVESQIKWIAIGSMPLHEKFKKKLLELLPNAKVVMEYGLTEAVHSTLLDIRANPHKLNTVGQASPGLEISIKDPDGKELPTGEVGEICVRGKNVAKGYWKLKEFQGDICTGDLGKLDQDKFLTFLGRKDDIINTGGNNFSPLEIELHLKSFLSGITFCICGIPDPLGFLGEIPVLCVEGQSMPPIEKLKEQVHGTLAAFKIPKRIYLFDDIPKTHNGKMKRSVLKDYIATEKYLTSRDL